MSSTVVLIACCGQKADTACKARDLYRSQLFRKSVAYAERRGLAWAILSAEHGVVMPDDVIAPYDVTLTNMSAAERRAWARKVNAQIRATFPAARFVVLAGKHYRAALDGAWILKTPCSSVSVDVPAVLTHEAPMEGMGIGDQLGFLTRDAACYMPEDAAELPGEPEVVRVCAACLACIHTGADPDFPFVLASAADCEAADHADNQPDAHDAYVDRYGDTLDHWDR
jgi:hypothetical protein